MTASPKFWNRIAQNYSKSPVADQESYEIKLNKTREYLNPLSEVFEFGCGTGSTAIYHSPFVKHIHAVDISEEMLAIAKEKTEKENIDNITYECGAIDDLEIEENKYDVVMAHSILHLLDDKEAVIAKIFKILKPGGVFISSTVCLTGIYKLLALIVPIARPFGLLPLVKFFDSKHLQSSITAAGFSIEHTWQKEGGQSIFIIARKPKQSDA